MIACDVLIMLFVVVSQKYTWTELPACIAIARIKFSYAKAWTVMSSGSGYFGRIQHLEFWDIFIYINIWFLIYWNTTTATNKYLC